MTVEALLAIILQYSVHLALGALITAVTVLYKKDKAKSDGIESLLRNALIVQCERHIAIGYIPTYSRDNIERMYVSYHNLGGNGSVTALVAQVRELPPEKLIIQEMKGE